MKKIVLFCICVLEVAFCFAQKKPANPGTPPKEVLQPGGTPQQKKFVQLKNAVSVQIGRDGGPRYQVTMFDNAAARTMLAYLSASDLLFPTYTYDENSGYVANRVRGSYTKGDEVSVTDIKAGELYLFSGGQLRLYFKDAKNANLNATPIGYLENAANIKSDVPKAHDDNKGDYWGVEVYFHLKKN